MSKANKSKAEKEKEIISKIKDILEKSNGEHSEEDESILEFLKFIFTNQFTKKEITLPETKGEKDSLNFLLNYTKLVHCLFQLSKEKRNKLYFIEVSKINDYDNEIYNLIFALNKIIGKTSNKILRSPLDSVFDKLKLIYSPLKGDISNCLLGRLAHYYFKLGLFLPSINFHKYILYKQIMTDCPEILDVFQYSDFCPDFNNETCQNLIDLYHDSKIKGDKEVLIICSLLIFLYDKIFYQLKEIKIKKFILQHVAKKTFAYLEQYEDDNFKNVPIHKIIYSKFLEILENTMNKLEQKKLFNLSNKNSEISNKTTSEELSVNISSSDNNQNSSSINLKEKNDIPSIDKLPENEDLLPKKYNEVNEIQFSENIPENKNIPMCETKKGSISGDFENKINENNEGKRTCSSLSETKNSSTCDNMMVHETLKYVSTFNKNKEEEKCLSKPENTNLNPHSELTKNVIKGDIATFFENNVELSEKQIEVMSMKNFFLFFEKKLAEQEKKFSIQISEQRKIITEHEKILSEHEKIITEHEKILSDHEKILSEHEKILSDHEKIISEQGKKIQILEDEIDDVKSLLGKIQITYLTRNFLSIFYNNLNKQEEDELNKDTLLIAFNRDYENCSQLCDKLIEKAGNTLQEGNNLVHTINPDDYGKKIDDIKKKLKNVINEPKDINKNLFLILINAAHDDISESLYFVNRLFNEEMKFQSK